ncbi:MAG: response regulator transcription factor [Planctomycetales bacterium]|nr:response regulator transcription factor [Planctomycetales bacterium]
MKVLVAEDDQLTRDGLVEILTAEGYETIAAENGRSAIDLFQREKPDFVCLDVMMPELSGYEVCKQIRKHANVPIVFISAKSEEIDKVVGLELGADDFIVKPFGVKEVVARIRAVTRRCLAKTNDGPSAANERFHMADLTISPAELRAERPGSQIDLSLRDVQILRMFFENANRVLDRPTIFRTCWGLKHFPNSRTLDQHISQLRKRIEIDPKNPVIIKTVHGVGYRYDA